MSSTPTQPEVAVGSALGYGDSMECGTCGAALSSTDERCRYCQTVTAYGHEALLAEKRRAREQTRRQEEQLRRTKDRARGEVDRTARRAFSWLLTGLFAAGLPNLLLGGWALLQAKRDGVRVPLRAVFALVAGVSYLGLFAVAFRLGMEEYRHHQQRVAGLDAEAAKRRGDEHLSVVTACVLFEQQVANEPLLGIVSRTSCQGPLDERGQSALLEGVRVRRLMDERQGAVCFERVAGKWQVGEFAEAPSCGSPSRSKVPQARQPKPKVKPRSGGKATIERPDPALRRNP